MSGIFGFSTSESNVNELADRLIKWNRIYGRNKTDSYSVVNRMIGCCLEKITDLPVPESAVIKKEKSAYAVDAIIFNRSEIFNMLNCPAENLSGISDEQLIVDYIHKFGLEALSKVNGDFAGAILSEDSSKLILFRNHMGTRPLFYYCLNNEVFFSTDIRGITAIPHLDMGINEDYLYKVLKGYIALSPTSTEYANIKCCPPGGYIEFDLSSTQITPVEHLYWQVGREKIRHKKESDYINKLNELITDAIKVRLETYKSGIASELSGGLDSGVISILINRLGYDCKYFSWSYSPDLVPLVEHDERQKIIDICKQEGLTCTYRRYDYTPDDVDGISAYSRDNLGIPFDKNVHLALRNVYPSETNTLTIRHALDYFSSENCRVVFSGHGGDEGVSHRPSLYELYYAGEYYHYFRNTWSSTHGKKKRVSAFLNALRSDRSSNQLMNATFIHSAEELLCDDFKKKMKDVKPGNHVFFFDPCSYVRAGGSRNRLDNMAFYGAYYGIRYAVPFLDYRVIDYAISIPRHLYVKGSTKRYIYREAFKDILPRSLYKSSRKQDGSYANAEDPDDWFEICNRERHDFVNSLDREYWSKYLDFNMLEKWLESGKPETFEDDKRFSIMYSLVLKIALMENTVKRSREICE